MSVVSAPGEAGHHRAAVLMVMLNSVATAMMLSAVNVALPEIADGLGIDAVTLSWIPMSYLMASAACVLAFGRLADMHGRKRIFLLGTVGVIVSSIVAAFAVDAATLIAGRFVQGIAAAMLYATHIAIISSVYPPARRGAAIGYTVSAIYVGLAAGPLAAGWLVELVSWRVTFLVHLPLALAALWIGVYRLPLEWKADDRGEFDALGAALYAVGIVVLMAGLARLPRPAGVAMLLAGAAGLWVFVRHEQRHPHPIFDVALFFTSRVFTLSCLASLVMYTTTFANIVLVSLYLQYLKAEPPGTTGMIMMAQPVMMAIFSPLAGRLSDSVEPRVIASLGMGLTAISLACFATFDAATPIVAVIGCLAATGLGFSLFSSPNANAIMGAVERSAYARASSVMSVMRVVGQMTSMGLVAMIFALMLGPVTLGPDVYPQLGRAISTCFGLGAGLCLIGAGLSLARGQMHAPRA